MPNRIIKESICTSENLNELTLEEEVFFYRLITQCDDFGRLDGRPQILRAKCFPLRTDTIQLNDIEAWLQSLVQQKLILLYEVDNKPYLYMVTWDKHQQKRAKNSKYPAPEDGSIIMQSSDITCNQVPANVPENTRIREYENTRNEDENRETNFDPEEIESGRRRVFKVFEQELCQTLSSFKVAQIDEWLKESSPELIIYALKIAILGNNRSFKYINGILKRWSDAGIKTVDDAQKRDKQFQEQKNKQKFNQQGNRASPKLNKCDTTGDDYETYIPPIAATGGT